MHTKPFVPANPRPFWTTHPVPVDVGEICKLCHIEQGAAVAELELIAQAGRLTVPARVSRNPVPSSALAVHATPSCRRRHEVVSPLGMSDLRAPQFEILRPSVVIRRRPKRD